MKVLVACEFSGAVRDAFSKLGHDATSCDLLPTEKPGKHYQGDVFDIINDGWDLMIAHPPCTYLTLAGNRWFKPEYKERYPNRQKQREDAIEFFLRLSEAKIPKIAIENPISIMSTAFRKPDQIIQPYQFGHPSVKATCLWLRGLPKLSQTNIVEPEYVTLKDGKKYSKWSSDTFKLPKEIRWKERSKTFHGIAQAMADQWGSVTEKELELT